MRQPPRLINIVGDPGSGKDFVIQATDDLGTQHAIILPKHTSRQRRPDDKSEMVCCNDQGYDLDGCDLIYENYGTFYGLKTKEIWQGLKRGSFVVSVVSNVEALNRLKGIFGDLLVMVYVHSQSTVEDFEKTSTANDDYTKRRVAEYRMAFNVYLDNYLVFDHVLIWSGDMENLLDQIFRLFRAYELGFV